MNAPRLPEHVDWRGLEIETPPTYTSGMLTGLAIGAGVVMLLWLYFG